MRRIKRIASARAAELQLSTLICNMRLVFDKSSSCNLIASGGLSVNGNITTNPNMLLFLGDFIQTIINLRYYITYRWLLNWAKYYSIKFSKVSNFKNNKSRRDLSKQVSYYLPN
jgi:hypothetical protein